MKASRRCPSARPSIEGSKSVRVRPEPVHDLATGVEEGEVNGTGDADDERGIRLAHTETDRPEAGSPAGWPRSAPMSAAPRPSARQHGPVGADGSKQPEGFLFDEVLKKVVGVFVLAAANCRLAPTRSVPLASVPKRTRPRRSGGGKPKPPRRPARPGSKRSVAGASAWRDVEGAKSSAVTRGGYMADRVGFEPTVGVNPRRFSRPLP